MGLRTWIYKHTGIKLKKFEDPIGQLAQEIETLKEEISKSVPALHNFDKQFAQLASEINALQNEVSISVSALHNDDKQFFLEEVRHSQAIAYLHQQVFPQFKNIYSGKDVAVVGTGPSLQYYTPLADIIHIGVNRAFLYQAVEFDYIFMMDYPNIKEYIEPLRFYRQGACKKFFGMYYADFLGLNIPESEALKVGAYRFFTSAPEAGFSRFIDSMPLACYYSMIYPALNFALYTNPKRIYLIGCDSNFGGYWDGVAQKMCLLDQQTQDYHQTKIMHAWHEFKTFSQMFYPQTEIISVNPVGLKGMFSDIYTDNNSDSPVL